MSDFTTLRCAECKPKSDYSADILLMCKGDASIKVE